MPKELMFEKLAASGLNDASIIEVHKLSYSEDKPWDTAPDRCNIQIPYFTINGEAVIDNNEAFCRVRFLGKSKKEKFGLKDGFKYGQTPGSGVHAYFSPLIDWKTVVKDTTHGVFITEGEFKSIKACIDGFTTIGLGGVDCWANKKRNLTLLPELEQFEWQSRQVIIVFDSDIVSNPNVAWAAQRLSRELVLRGAIVSILEIPSTGDQKVGLDDFLMSHGRLAFADLARNNITPYLAAQQLLEFNRRYCVVASQEKILDLDTHMIYSQQGFELITSNIIGKIKTVTKLKAEDGSDVDQIEFIEVNMGKYWLKSGNRRLVQGIIYKPGYDRFVNIDGFMYYNKWKPSNIEPKKGSTKLFQKYIDALCQNISKEAKKTFLQWIAYPLQNLGKKTSFCVVLYSQKEGTGKTTLGEIIGRLYGKSNYSVIDSQTLSDTFTADLVEKQFIQGEEITGETGSEWAARKYMDKIKGLITQNVITVKQKYQKNYVVDDVANYLFTTNNDRAFTVTKESRRFFMIDTSNNLDEEFFNQLRAECFSDEGLAAIYDYLINIDLSDFRPHVRPPITTAFVESVEANYSDMQLWCKQLLDSNGAAIGKSLGLVVDEVPDILSYQYAKSAYEKYSGKSITTKGLITTLLQMGAMKLNNGKQLRLSDRLDYFIALRNFDKYEKLNKDLRRQIAKEL